ncbi:hypothetical protein LF1_41480 [Rubripirellula obstinata]|uniref:Uncharacterized protein n=1 Tax=Rubripirellula obstinata TaxID=406547 RepID=A0A5B1CK66_9BACT|nr:hypothetical protein LF1_41480 [Rubripirellula obstinata]
MVTNYKTTMPNQSLKRLATYRAAKAFSQKPADPDRVRKRDRSKATQGEQSRQVRSVVRAKGINSRADMGTTVGQESMPGGRFFGRLQSRCHPPIGTECPASVSVRGSESTLCPGCGASFSEFVSPRNSPSFSIATKKEPRFNPQ